MADVALHNGSGERAAQLGALFAVVLWLKRGGLLARFTQRDQIDGHGALTSE